MTEVYPGTRGLSKADGGAAKRRDKLTKNDADLPPVPKYNQKQSCPSPPSVLKDKKSTVQFTKGKLLGEGGFAKCYEVWDQNGTRFAAKVVPKVSLKSEKSKQKLFTEIKIHQNLKHPNIVKFKQVFEDSSNVYMILELCENKTFVEMIKKRRKLLEAEARYYMKQLLDALTYLHQKRVIHRDLKLGNLFLSGSMDIKVGDFGLATIVKYDGERKKTICGTPNYIAPEILFDREHGHSFEVDLWSIGVILYTFLVGKPPFQTKDVKEIYRNIRENNYVYPEGCGISAMSKNLISSLLSSKPSDRPTIQEIFDHPWFQLNIPKHIPASALLTVPELFATNQMAMFNKLQIQSMETPSAAVSKRMQVMSIQREAAVRRTPLSDLKNKQSPLVVAVRDVQVTATKPVTSQSPLWNVQKMQKENVVVAPKESVTPVHNITGTPASSLARMSIKSGTPSTPVTYANNSDKAVSKLHISPQQAPAGGRKSMLESMLYHISEALACSKSGKPFKFGVPSSSSITAPKVFISKWIDYSNKYGLGYQLTNGSIGVHFNDSSSIILAANEQNFEYLEYAKGTERSVMNRHAYTLGDYPQSLNKKVTLLKHFTGYMNENLYKAEYAFQDVDKTQNLDFLVKYMRTKHAVMFRLTNRIVQINFFDHSKLILSQDGLVVTFINRDRQLKTYSLAQIVSTEKGDILSRLKYACDILDNLTKPKSSQKEAGSAEKQNKF
ncbi:hypothetical protein MP228_008727 [Amoeboaphelidium protococcarum]|nr:hypothetical protein MP228_008727 [Amoeboaphelidium protococcarum]